jgi:transcriptional regulator of arginine metabolism
VSETRRRRQAILRIVSTERIETQNELASALVRQGFSVSQSSVSRDVAALGLFKVAGRYARQGLEASTVDDPDRETLRRNVLEVRTAGDHLLVVITPPGGANPTAIALEHRGWPEVVGTLAGDDTVFVAVRDAAACRKLRGRLRKLAA